MAYYHRNVQVVSADLGKITIRKRPCEQYIEEFERCLDRKRQGKGNCNWRNIDKWLAEKRPRYNQCKASYQEVVELDENVEGLNQQVDETQGLIASLQGQSAINLAILGLLGVGLMAGVYYLTKGTAGTKAAGPKVKVSTKVKSVGSIKKSKKSKKGK